MASLMMCLTLRHNDQPTGQVCTLEFGHDGAHVAHGPQGRIMASWERHATDRFATEAAPAAPSVNVISSTDLEPRMKVRRTNDSGLMWRVTGNAFRTVADAQFVNGWVHVRFADGTGMDARPGSTWEVLG